MFHWLSRPAGKPPQRGKALTASGTYGGINLLSFQEKIILRGSAMLMVFIA
jgi:hypothetical protein